MIFKEQNKCNQSIEEIKINDYELKSEEKKSTLKWSSANSDLVYSLTNTVESLKEELANIR